ncbi:hypothetical protein EMGBS10_12210 [Opitutia bacterium]|nr:hypothetical protein EMGBS10_12210 [Opitutae bacterium]
MSSPRLSLPRQALLGLAVGVVYGLVCRLLFDSKGNPSEVSKDEGLLAIMSLSFIFLVPMALGFLVVWFSETQKSWARRVFRPWLAGLAFMAAAIAFHLEGFICVILWLPLVWFMSSLGGVLAGVLRDARASDGSKRLCVAAVALLPFVAGPLESLRERETEIRTAHASIEIAASPARVWRQIRSVPRITEAEHGPSWSHRLGFPRPTEAVLEGTGVGSVRYARFEGDVLFVEKVTEWEENKRLSFSIAADTKNIPPTTFDEHVTIGGPYFDVLHGTYWIEALGPDRVVLHLSSDQRLSTGFNFYSQWWTVWLMNDLQSYILRIIKARAERDR